MSGSFDDPHRLRRLAPGLIGLGAICGLCAMLLRDSWNPGSLGHSATYLLDTLGWLLAFAGAVAAARLGSIYFRFKPASVRRRAILAAVSGTAVCLLSCVLISGVDDAPLLVRLLAAALLIGGLGAGLAGLLTLAVTEGSRYAADRLANLDDQ